MRPFRLLLATTVVALGAVVPAAVPSASAPPPVGCYGLPDYPSAFVCVTEFNPGNAIGGGSSVTVPRACAGDCYGPFSVPVPAGGSGSGTIATVTYGGQTYVIVAGQVPQPGAGQECPGEHRLLNDLGIEAETEPYACAHAGYNAYNQWVWFVGTCAVGTCHTVEVDPETIGLIGRLLDMREVDKLLADVMYALSCEANDSCID